MAIGCLQTEANNYKPNTTLPRRGNPEQLAIANTLTRGTSCTDAAHYLHKNRMETVLGQFQRTVNLPDAQETSREVVGRYAEPQRTAFEQARSAGLGGQ